MANKKIWLGILVMVMVLGMTACPTDGGGADTWIDVTSLMQLNGTWKGSYTETQSQGGVTVKATAVITMTINATSATTGIVSVLARETYSGITDAYWNSLKAALGGSDIPDIISITFNDSTHTVTMQISSQPLNLYDPNEGGLGIDLGKAQINQNSTKLKTIDSASGRSIIYTKQ